MGRAEKRDGHLLCSRLHGYNVLELQSENKHRWYKTKVYCAISKLSGGLLPLMFSCLTVFRVVFTASVYRPAGYLRNPCVTRHNYSTGREIELESVKLDKSQHSEAGYKIK